MPRPRVFLASLLMALFAVFLSSCYLPVRFDTEITLNRFGIYDIKFDGYMAETDLYEEIRSGKILPIDENERVTKIRNDLTRESATQSVQYFGKGIFKLNWHKSGDLLKYSSIMFLRRNNMIFTLAYEKDRNRFSFTGAKHGKNAVKKMLESGLGTEGQIRFFAKSKAIDHNATRTADAGERGTVYIWDVRSPADPAPFLHLAL